MAAPIPENESERLQRLRELVVLDSEPEPVFDSLARLASQLCGTPIAAVSLIDSGRQWFKAQVGLHGVNQTPRDVAICAHAIQGDSLFEVPDTLRDQRFADNPLVLGAPGIRFYAGAPLVLSDGCRIGTLCVIDRQSRQLTPEQGRQLQALAQIAVQALEMRRTLIERSLSVRSASETELAESEARHRAILDAHNELISQARPDGTLTYVNPAYAQHFKRSVPSILGTRLYDYVEPADREAVRDRIDWVLSTGERLVGENRMSNRSGEDQWFVWTNTRQVDAQGQPLLHSVGRDISARKRAEEALRESEALLQRTGRLAGIGGWQLDLVSQVVTWSAQTRVIHEVDADYVPTLDGALQFYAPEARSTLTEAVSVATQTGGSWDLELPFITARGRHIWVRSQGEAELLDGVAVRLVGAFQDITERKLLEQRVEEDERFLRLVTDSLPQRMGYLDRQLRYRFVNHAHLRRFGLGRKAILGRTRAEITGVPVPPDLMARYQAALAGREQGFEFEEPGEDGLRRMQALLLPDTDALGHVQGFITNTVDITEAARARHELLLQTATLRAVTEAIPAIVAVVGTDRRYRFVNSAFERWIGLPRERIVGRVISEVLGTVELERSQPWIDRVLAGESVQFERVNPSGGERHHLTVSYVPLYADGGEIDGFIGVGQDITVHRQEQTRLLRLSERDALTGLLNRAGLERRIEAEVLQGRGAHLAFLYVDLDHFKPVNDQFGHAAGDQVLQQFGQRVQALIRPTDVVSRLGGDEYAVLLFGVREADHANIVANKIIAAAGAPFDIEGQQIRIGASVGIALGVPEAGGWQELVSRADTQLYRAKFAGRGQQAGVTDWTPDPGV